MHHLTFIRHPRYAQAFVDYLKSVGIEASSQIREDGANIFIEREAELPKAQQELAMFLQEPDHERYRQASWLVQEESAETEKLTRMYSSNALATVMKMTGLFTKLVIVICVLVYLLTAQGMSEQARAPFMFFGSYQAMGDLTQFWRWITPAFVHFGIFHFAFNMSAWWIFGGMVERTQSTMRLFTLFMICGLISNAVQFVWSGDRFGGLSGVVYGVLGYLWFYERFSDSPPFRLPQGLVVFMLIALALGFADFLPTANQAHLSGLLSGCLLGWFLARLDRGPT
jgi:GlpG protein